MSNYTTVNHITLVLLPYMPRIELMFSLPERPSIFSMLRFTSSIEDERSYLDYLTWIGGSFSVFQHLSSLHQMLLVSSYYLFYQILMFKLLALVFSIKLDFIFSGEMPSALLTAPFTPLLTRSLGVGSGFVYFTGSSTYLVYFFLSAANLSSSLLAMTLAQNCNCRTKPSPGWMQGLPFFTFSLASSYGKLQALMTQAITKELLLDTPAQQCTNTPPFFLPYEISLTTSSSNYTGSFCCLLSWISQK